MFDSDLRGALPGGELKRAATKSAEESPLNQMFQAITAAVNELKQRLAI